MEQYLKFEQSLKSALRLQGLALLCTAINQTLRQQLSLFHALCVLHILTLLGFAIGVDYKTAHMPPATGVDVRRLLRRLLRGGAVAAYIVLTLVVWVTRQTFGSQPACNEDTAFVVFFLLIHPASYPADAIFLFPTLTIMFSLFWLSGRWHPWGIIGLFLNGCGFRIPGDVRLLPALRAFRDEIGQENPEDLDSLTGSVIGYSRRVYHIGEICANLLVNIGMVVSLELTVSRNRIAAEEQQWAFGQVVAMFLLLGVVWEVLDVVLAKLDERRSLEEFGEMENEESEGAPPTDVGHTYDVPMPFYPQRRRNASSRASVEGTDGER